MEEKAVFYTGENSPEHVAFKLLQEVALAEGKNLFDGPGAPNKPDRKWILDAYAECILAVTNPSRSRGLK